MSLTILFLLTAMGSGLALVKWRRSSRIVFAIVLILFLFVGYGLIPSWLFRNLQAGYSAEFHGPWGARSAIVLLGGGTERPAINNEIDVGVFAYSRVVKAFELYLECKRNGGACLLLVTGGDSQDHGVSEAAVYGLLLRRLGVATTDLVLEERSMNTWQNAQFSAALLKPLNVSKVLLVTSGYHLHRALLYFSHFAINATPVRAEYIDASWRSVPVAYNFMLTDVALHECLGMMQYYLYQLLGWNEKK